MKDGILRIADFGRAKQVGKNDQIADMYSLGDMRKFSPEIVAFIRKCLGEIFETVESFSGKSADVWAAGLYVWELLEDDTNNLFSTKKVPVQEMAINYTYEFFEELVEKISCLKEKYSIPLLNLLRQVLTVDPGMRATTSQIQKKLTGMTEEGRKAVFEAIMKQVTRHETATEERTTVPVYFSSDPAMYVKKPTAQQQTEVYVPADFYTKQKNAGTGAEEQTTVSVYTPADPAMYMKKLTAQQQAEAYLPSDFYAQQKK
jgi:serine/threonine protein kinase